MIMLILESNVATYTPCFGVELQFNLYML